MDFHIGVRELHIVSQLQQQRNCSAVYFYLQVTWVLSKPDPGFINWSKHLGLLGTLLKTPGGGGGGSLEGTGTGKGLYCRLTAGRVSKRLFEPEHIILWESIATVPHAQIKE